MYEFSDNTAALATTDNGDSSISLRCEDVDLIIVSQYGRKVGEVELDRETGDLSAIFYGSRRAWWRDSLKAAIAAHVE